MTVSIHTLAQFSLFANLDRQTLEDFSKLMILRKYPAGAIVQMQDDPCTLVGFVYSGAAVVFRMSQSGREQVLSNLAPGMHFNTVPAMDANVILRASVRSLTPLMLLLIPVEDYRSLLHTHPDLAYLILTDFAHRLDHLTSLVEELSLHSVRGRLARFLLDQADGEQISKQWTQDEIASYLGTVRDVVGRTLRGFMDAGLIQRKGDSLVLLDRQRLEEETLT